jgi:exoribonuclease-2
LRAARHARGALTLQTLQARAVFADGELRDLRADERNRAKDLIEDVMIAANGAVARFLQARGLPSLRRVLRSPERWQRIVELAARLHARLPDVPDARALGAFLEAQRAADPERFPDLSLSIVKLLGRGEYALAHAGGTRTSVSPWVTTPTPPRRIAGSRTWSRNGS